MALRAMHRKCATASLASPTGAPYRARTAGAAASARPRRHVRQRREALANAGLTLTPTTTEPMTRDLLNALTTLQIVVLCVALSVCVAVVLAVVLRWLIPDPEEGRFERLSEGLRVVYELLFALILAFVIASVLDKFNDADRAVGAEAAGLSQMMRNNLAYPPEQQALLGRGVGTYVRAVVTDEWRTMRDGEPSPEAAATLETLYALYADYEPPERLAELHGRSLEHLDEVAAARRERLSQAAAELPGLLVIILPLGGLLLLVVEYRPTLGRRSQMFFMGTLALVLSVSYLLTIVLDYPFSGDISISYEPLQSDALAQFAVLAPRREQAGDRQLRLTSRDLEGVWNSAAYGTVLLRRRGTEVRGVYRLAQGAIRGSVSPDGVFRGVWCEGPTRRPGTSDRSSDAGLVEWRLIDAPSGGRAITGIWSYGFARAADGRLRPAGAWDLRRLRIDTPFDLERRLRTDPDDRFCTSA